MRICLIGLQVEWNVKTNRKITKKNIWRNDFAFRQRSLKLRKFKNRRLKSVLCWSCSSATVLHGDVQISRWIWWVCRWSVQLCSNSWSGRGTVWFQRISSSIEMKSKNHGDISVSFYSKCLGWVASLSILQSETNAASFWGMVKPNETVDNFEANWAWL